jgi:hypothetical protein
LTTYKPTHLIAHMHFLPTQEPNNKMQKSYQANAQQNDNGQTNNDRERRANA